MTKQTTIVVIGALRVKIFREVQYRVKYLELMLYIRLILKMLSKIAANDILNLFPGKMRFDISYELSAKQMINMKCLNLFSGVKTGKEQNFPQSLLYIEMHSTR